MGTFAVQMAAARGAHVTGVDSAAKRELVLSLGADGYIDYMAQDPTRGDERYDLVLDVYARRSVRDWQPILTPTGRYEMAGGSSFRILSGFTLGSWLSRSNEQKLGLLMGWPHTRQDMDEVNAMIASGQVRPIIGHRFPLEEAATALRMVKDHGSLGKVMLDIAER